MISGQGMIAARVAGPVSLATGVAAAEPAFRPLNRAEFNVCGGDFNAASAPVMPLRPARPYQVATKAGPCSGQ